MSAATSSAHDTNLLDAPSQLQAADLIEEIRRTDFHAGAGAVEAKYVRLQSG